MERFFAAKGAEKLFRAFTLRGGMCYNSGSLRAPRRSGGRGKRHEVPRTGTERSEYV